MNAILLKFKQSSFNLKIVDKDIECVLKQPTKLNAPECGCNEMWEKPEKIMSKENDIFQIVS